MGESRRSVRERERGRKKRGATRRERKALETCASSRQPAGDVRRVSSVDGDAARSLADGCAVVEGGSRPRREVPRENSEGGLTRQTSEKNCRSTNYYELLGLAKDGAGVDDDVLKRAYNKAVLLYHPDKRTGPDEGDAIFLAVRRPSGSGVARSFKRTPAAIRSCSILQEDATSNLTPQK